MKLEEMIELFEKYEDDYLEFEKIEIKLHNRPDIHAFILLDKLVPSESDIVSAAEHDQIWLDVEPEDLAKVVTREQVLELRRAGVFYDEETDSLSMFV